LALERRRGGHFIALRITRLYGATVGVLEVIVLSYGGFLAALGVFAASLCRVAKVAGEQSRRDLREARLWGSTRSATPGR
jgi:hypothetical protein